MKRKKERDSCSLEEKDKILEAKDKQTEEHTHTKTARADWIRPRSRQCLGVSVSRHSREHRRERIFLLPEQIKFSLSLIIGAKPRWCTHTHTPRPCVDVLSLWWQIPIELHLIYDRLSLSFYLFLLFCLPNSSITKSPTECVRIFTHTYTQIVSRLVTLMVSARAHSFVQSAKTNLNLFLSVLLFVCHKSPSLCQFLHIPHCRENILFVVTLITIVRTAFSPLSGNYPIDCVDIVQTY